MLSEPEGRWVGSQAANPINKSIMKKLQLSLLAALSALMAASAQAQDNGALLDLLVRKKVISDQEAESVRAELMKEDAATSAGKLNLSSSLTELKLSGDLRMRYQADDREWQVPSADSSNPNLTDRNDSQRSRWRFRLRLNADMKLGSDFFAGVQLQTSQSADSGNQTYQDGFNNYDIFISRAFLGWNATDWLTIVAGKQPNPFYTTDLVWDTDINPTGLTQSIRLDRLFAGVDESGIREDSPWTLALNLGQFIYDDNNEELFDNDASSDAYLFAGQLVGTYKFSNNVTATFAPGILFANSADVSGLINENPFTDVEGVSGETRKLVVLTAPGEVAFKLGQVPTTFYWDFAYNTAGEGRADDVYGMLSAKPDGEIRSNHEVVDDIAWLAGIQFGKLKKAGDWALNLNWRQTGITSVDPNLNDSDFALGELNTRGLKVGAFYNFTDFISAGVTYYHAWNLRDDLIWGQSTRGAAVADANTVKVFQVDVNVKF